MESVATITTNMAHAIGTTQYIRHFTGLLFTDGVDQLRADADCHWLVDAIGSYKRKEEFQVWELKVNTETHKAVLTMCEDSDKPYKVTQKIGHTDFPLENVKFYVQLGSLDGVTPEYILMLTSEY